MVIMANSSRRESHVVTSLRDIEDLVINTMGEDIWQAIMIFIDEDKEDLEETNDCIKEDIRDYDSSLHALRNGVRDEIQVINRLGNYVNSTNRINRAHIIQELEGISRRLIDNEGYV